MDSQDTTQTRYDGSPSGRPLALITGASSGIGYELAIQFAKNGYDLLIVSGSEGIERAADQLKDFNVEVKAVRHDLTQEAEVDALCNDIRATGRPIAAAALNAGADFAASRLFAINEQKYFASLDGSWIDQDIHRLWLPFTVTAVDKATGKFRTRDGLGAPVGMGYEYLQGDPAQKHQLPGGLVAYGLSYDAREDAVAAAKQARAKLSAPSVKPGKYDLVIDPSNLFLTIHESVGHPLELDRVLGYEANYAGTSFATIDKRDAGFRWGSELVNFVADKTRPGSLGAVGYDDEGVKTKQWDLVRDGILVDYQCTRDQAHILGKAESDGCSYADAWSSVQFQRMPNVSLAAGRQPLDVARMIAGVDKGLYIHGRASYSIDQQRYNAQFGGQLIYEIEHGKVTRLVEDGAYQIRTPEFWNSVTAICDESDFRLGGSFFDGKGQPGQVSAVSHGSATTRFDGVNVINTARSLG